MIDDEIAELERLIERAGEGTAYVHTTCRGPGINVDRMIKEPVTFDAEFQKLCDGYPIVDLLIDSGLATCKYDAVAKIDKKRVRVGSDWEKTRLIADVHELIYQTELEDSEFWVRVGKKKSVLILSHAA